jgi:hypothetical protein
MYGKPAVHVKQDFFTGTGKISLATWQSSDMTLRGEMLEVIQSLDEARIAVVHRAMMGAVLKLQWEGQDLSGVFPDDAIRSVASFLGTRDLCTWQSCSRSMKSTLDFEWRRVGLEAFPNMYLEGKQFLDYPSSSWFEKYITFMRSKRISKRRGTTTLQPSGAVVTYITLPGRISCTIPSKFSISLHGSTYVEMTVNIKFSPDAVRSVVGLIDIPHYLPHSAASLDCDRGLSRKYWGLAFGPLTGVVSSRGKYFDNFRTYRARHGLRDYLTLALHELVTVRVGIFIHNGKVAFYRLPEHDYCDWECTGFIYDCFDTASHPSLLLVSQVFPALMLSSIGQDDHIGVSIDKLSSTPPYFPHSNSMGLNFSTWSSFADPAVMSLLPIPPPNTPVSQLVREDDELDRFHQLI